MARKKATRKKKTTRKTTKAKPRKLKASGDWYQDGTDQLKAYLKKVRATNGKLFVLNDHGDLILQAGKIKDLDTTSLGALTAGLRGLSHQLDTIVKSKTITVNFGEDKKGHWVEFLKDWMIVGVKTSHKPSQLKGLVKHLKKSESKKAKGIQFPEALAGLSEMSIEAKLVTEEF